MLISVSAADFANAAAEFGVAGAAGAADGGLTTTVGGVAGSAFVTVAASTAGAGVAGVTTGVTGVGSVACGAAGTVGVSPAAAVELAGADPFVGPLREKPGSSGNTELIEATEPFILGSASA